MLHPHNTLLQAYLDGELAPAAHRRVELHLATCPSCQAAIRLWQHASSRLRRTLPPANAFCGEGEFWGRLVNRLPSRRPTTWPVITYLPPFFFGTLGTVVEGLISTIFVLYALVILGVLPEPRATLGRHVAQWASHPALASSLYAWLGWSDREVAATLQQWITTSLASQEHVIFAMLIVALDVLLSITVGLCLSWIVCWTQTQRR